MEHKYSVRRIISILSFRLYTSCGVSALGLCGGMRPEL